ncbi:NahK/ErcS family hybrid sensor histidine kinase/response regulator [Marinobacter sp. CA1]|uniref:hybrid sensor histidine kinase/response regulator n=1 Tax=Marinobacter sp. CA1 TaxID=2817656 RepID=UPI001D09516A|nr:NahK/ErcS family hybrid sensor histidine kinase/response regulator [Marinobacter sp. CA1]MCG8517044.1 PAS-domain containing protein [Pseudomonadales bacterium]UDL03701.1 hybrid sensor histidine kinase/response regulator [Marinobacter sp. CA1]
MLSGWLLVLISITYISLLFAIAWAGDRHPTLYRHRIARTHVYALSLAVYFTSWTFYGAVGRATQEGIGFLPIYLGPLLVFLFGASLIRRIIYISKRNNSTSIADFIASRYGKSQSLAALIALVALIGSVPYISLQLKAISMGFNVLADNHQVGIGSAQPAWTDSAWYITLVLAVFTVLFGTRHLESTEHHRGMIQAVAFESLIKLTAFIAVGLFVGFGLYNGFGDLFRAASEADLVGVLTTENFEPIPFVTQTLIGMLAIICLPRQFHVMVVENTDHRDFNVARWAMPAYLIIASAFVIPIAAAGMLHPGVQGSNPDIMILNLPIQAGEYWLAILAFLGGGSAAAAMVIVCSVAIATMVSNEIIMPALLKFFRPRMNQQEDLSHLLLSIRRVAIFVVMLTAYGFYRLASEDYSLTAFGLLSFAAAAQFGPALVGGILWRRGNHTGAFWGLVVGFVIWIYTLLIPALASTGWLDPGLIEQGLWGLSWTRPTALMGLEMDTVSHGTIWSLGLNTLTYICLSLLTRQRVREKIQIASFFHDPEPKAETPQQQAWEGEVLTADLQALADRFMGEERADALFRNYERRNAIRLSPQRPASAHLMKYIERQLASVIGASTARVVLESTLTGRDMQIEDVVSIVDEASQAMTFSRELLQSAIENISLGVSVVNHQQQLVVWNQNYLELFSYPRGFVRVGRPIEDLMRYNLTSSNLPARKIDEIIDDRCSSMRKGERMSYERHRPDGTVIKIDGSPIPGGGYVTTFQDITAMRRTEKALKETNIYLEQRVKERTQELQIINEQMLKAKSVAEQANQSKTRFLASASHDLLQPLNAARLFTSALAGKPHDQETNELVEHIDSSLSAAEEIISTLLDISKLDAGALEPQITRFPISDLLRTLANDFSAIAADSGLELHVINSSAWVRSDIKLLRRVIQNFLSNAIRYTPKGRILMGCRRLRGFLRIEVWDTGPGIPEDQLAQIFEEFKRLQHNQDKKGLGLGLAIVDRISGMLDHPVNVNSVQGRGSVFSITVPLAPADTSKPADTTPRRSARSVSTLRDLHVLCIDNDAKILQGMEALLNNWQCQVTAAASLEDAVAKLEGRHPAIILADYQLDDDKNGLDAMDAIRQTCDSAIPGILITGYLGAEVKEDALERGYQILYKPVKPAALRALVNKLLKQRRS